MVNILLDGLNIESQWIYKELKSYIKKDYMVTVIPFSFRDNQVKNSDEWNTLYGKMDGKIYRKIVRGFSAYDIPEYNISFVNYFIDTKESAQQKIKRANIIYFTGGLPDRLMDRIKKFDLYDIIMEHNEVVMGYSAGALVQLEEYHLSPDEDYPDFKYCKGFPFLSDFYVEFHYKSTSVQNAAINHVLAERRKKVYAVEPDSGAILVENGNIHLIGNVQFFEMIRE